MNRSRHGTLAAFLLAMSLAGPLDAQGLGCPIRKEQPVIMTKFELGPILRGKVPVAAFEQEMSRRLSEALRCNSGLQFLEWLDGSANLPSIPAGPRKGVLQVSMVLDGNPPRAPIRLVFKVTEGGLLREELNLGPAAVLYGVQDSQVPGKKNGGGRWKADLEGRFRDLARNQAFVGDLVRAFKFVPIIQSDDLLISQSDNVIGLPVSPGRLSAGPKTQVDLEFLLRAPEEIRATKALWVNCLLRTREWDKRLQLALVENASEVGQVRNQDWPEFSSKLANRIPGSTGAYLRSFEWQAPGICGRYEGPH